MIKIADRSDYYDKYHTNLRWYDLPLGITFENIKFHYWVYAINKEVYTHCTQEFKEAFNKAKVWEGLSQ